MSDLIYTISPLEIKVENISQFKSKIEDLLLNRGVISKEARPTKEALSILKNQDKLFLSINPNYVEFVTSRQILYDGNDLEAIYCPSCGFNVIEDNYWDDAINNWFTYSESYNLECSNCKVKNSITKYNFLDKWFFSECSVSFWNWPDLKDSFIHEIEVLTETKIKALRNKL